MSTEPPGQPQVSLVSAPEGRFVTTAAELSTSGNDLESAPDASSTARQLSLAEGERAMFRCVAPAGQPVWPLVWKLGGRVTTHGAAAEVTTSHLPAGRNDPDPANGHEIFRRNTYGRSTSIYCIYITGVGASSNDEKTLASTITYTASAADNGGNLSCEAMNSVSDSLRADTIRLNILCMFAISLWNMD